MGKIYTFGYTKNTFRDFIKNLQRHQINLIIDVRNRPLDKHYPEFNKFNLIKRLQQNQLAINYLYLKELACPPSIQSVQSEELGLLKYFQQYERYLQKEKKLIVKLAKYIQDLNICLFCMETDPKTCHRTMIADYLQIQNCNSQIEHWV